MKKILMFIISFLFVLFLASCNLLTLPTTTSENQSTSEETSSIDTHVTTSDSTVEVTNTTTEITTNITAENTTNITTQSTTNTTTTTESGEAIIPTGYSLIQDELETIGIPAVGDVKILVFAVDFPDNLISNPNDVLSDLNLAFNGSSIDLAYESLNSYYLKSSFNKLNITADIFGFYTAENDSYYYELENDRFYATDPYTGEYLYNDASHPDSDIIFELLEYYVDVIDYSDYDSNNDGYIDGIYIMYNHEISYESGSDLWWAYQYYYWYDDNFDDVSPNYYVWTGIDFLYEGNEDINARTIIHETGHMLGLEDYYDYYPDDSVNSGGLGAFMMDYTIGDHEPFSKILLGWITPIVVESSMTIDILPNLVNGDVILIIDEWNNTIFDEYLLVMYFKPEGLNEMDQDYMFSSSGIIIFHISAAIDNGYDSDSYYYSIFNNNNTDTPNKLIKIIEADMDGDIEKYQIVENTDLFLTGDIFGETIYPNYKWYTNEDINLTINIVEIDEIQAKIGIIFK